MPAAHKCAPASAFSNDTAGGAGFPAKQQGGAAVKKGLRRMYLAFLSPVVIAFLIAYLYPVLRTVQMSFFEVSDISAARDTWEFVGLYNYVDLFSRQLFRVSFKNMMLIFLAGGAAVFLISLFFAWVLHKGMFMDNLWRNLIYPRSSRPWP